MKIFPIIAFPTRVIVALVVIFVRSMEIGAEWITGVNNRTEYVKKGKCKQCGECCNLLGIYVPKILRRFGRLIAAWHKLAYNFDFQGEDQGWHLYSCKYVKPDGKCGIYHFRHRICREFPKPKYFGRPYLHRNCGFRFDRRDGKPDFESILRKKFQNN